MFCRFFFGGGLLNYTLHKFRNEDCVVDASFFFFLEELNKKKHREL